MIAISKYLFHPAVPVVKITGRVNSILVNQINNQLKSINKGTVQALAVVINSNGGTNYDINSLSEKLQNYSKDNHIPIYTFAQQQAMGGAYSLLTIGDKVYAQRSSLLGSTGAVTSLLRMKQLLASHGIHQVRMGSNSNLTELYYDELGGSSEIARQFIEQAQESQNQLLLGSIKRSGLPSDINEKIYRGDEALKYGMIDELGTYEDVLSRMFPQARLKFLTRESKIKQWEEWFYFLVKVSQSRGFLAIVALLLLKFIIKWTLLVYWWKQMRNKRRLQQN